MSLSSKGLEFIERHEGYPLPYANNPLRFIDPTGHDPGSGWGPVRTLPEDQMPARGGVTEAASGLGGDYPGTSVNSEQAQQQVQQTAQSLAAQVPSEAKAAIAASVNSSNSPTSDDKKGGFHEEGGFWGTTTSGNTVVVPAKPGPYSSPTDKTAHIDPGNSVNPSLKDNLQSVGGFWHVHPKGGGDRTFVQPPSGADKANAVAPINIVVGAGNKRVYFYNSSGVVKEMSLKQFMKEP